MSAASGQLGITWLGHSTVTITSPGGKVLLIDPWVMNNPKTPDDQKTIDHLDLMLITHGHYDHIGDGVQIARATTPQVVPFLEIGIHNRLDKQFFEDMQRHPRFFCLCDAIVGSPICQRGFRGSRKAMGKLASHPGKQGFYRPFDCGSIRRSLLGRNA